MAASSARTDRTRELAEHVEAIQAKARQYGLDFFEVVFEVLDFDTMNQIASYGGFPIRYPHWRWGMEYEKLSRRDAYGLGRIYEMVINNDPVYAYLQEANALTDQKLVMAHVYGHADFFKNNFWFSRTNRKMMDEMANHATRIRRHVERHGQETVERFIDACLSIEHLIDPHSMFVRRDAPEDDAAGTNGAREPDRLPAKDYMEPFINPPERLEQERQELEASAKAERGKFPRKPTRDVLLFLIRHAPLEDWQQDVLSMIRDEAYYFAPQAMTKIMNEGWATYWHSKLMTQHFADAREIIHYCDQHAGVIHMPPGGFNPYKIGLELWKEIERRWDRGQHGSAWESLEGIGAKEAWDDKSMQGRDKIFEIRRVYNDVSFIDEFLTPEFVERNRMYAHRRDPHTGEVRVVSRDFDRVKQTLLHHLTNRGEPFIHVADANYLNRGELFLAHQFTGLEVDAARAVEVLKNVRLIWGRPVHLQARINEEMMLMTLNEPDGEPSSERISDETPPPAHLIE